MLSLRDGAAFPLVRPASAMKPHHDDWPTPPLWHDRLHPFPGCLSMTRPRHRARAIAVAETRYQNTLLFWRLTGLGLAALAAWYWLPPLSVV